MCVINSTKPTDVQLKSVLIATDFSPASDRALHHALKIARHFGAELYLFHVVSSIGLTIAGPGAIAAAATLAFREASVLERKLVTTGALRNVRFHVIVREGDISDQLHKVVRQEGIDLVVLGTHSRKGLGRLMLGSVAEQIFRSESCLIVTVGPNSPTGVDFESEDQRGSFLFATDFSDSSLAALPYAVSFANYRRARLILLHMLAPVPQVDGNRWYTADDVIWKRGMAEAEARYKLKQLTTDIPLELEPMQIAEYGEASDGILACAEKFCPQVIVLGLRRRIHIEAVSHLPWSTAYEVVCGASCPVLTVRS